VELVRLVISAKPTIFTYIESGLYDAEFSMRNLLEFHESAIATLKFITHTKSSNEIIVEELAFPFFICSSWVSAEKCINAYDRFEFAKLEVMTNGFAVQTHSNISLMIYVNKKLIISTLVVINGEQSFIENTLSEPATLFSKFINIEELLKHRF
jgi:hypothetical protein